MERRVQMALSLWGLEGAKAELAAQRENVVWRVDHASGSYALRFHRPGYRTPGELRSELQWMDYLSGQGMSVPRPLAATDGRLVAEIEGYQTDILTWLQGAPIGETGQLHNVDDPTALCHQIGREMARLHDLTDQWNTPADFARPDWGREGLLGDHPLWGRFWEHPDLTDAQHNTLLQSRDEAKQHLAEIEDTLDRGLIHADLLTENIMVHEGQLSLIDFDDSAFGYRDFELATFLIRFLPSPDFEAMRKALCEGYSTRRRVDPDILDFMLFLRSLTYIGWIIPRIDEPGGAARSVRNITTAMPLAEAYLKRRHP